MFPRIQAKPSVKNCLRHSNADKTEQCWLKNKNCLNPDCKIESFQHTYAHTYEITRYWIHSEFGRNSRIAGILSWNRGTFKKELNVVMEIIKGLIKLMLDFQVQTKA